MCFHYIFFISCAWIFHDDHFVIFYISYAFLMITLYHIKVFSFLQLSLQFLFVGKTEMLITFVGVFESWTFQQSQSQNPNLNWTKIIIILDYYSTLGTRLLPQKWFLYQILKFYYGFLLSEKMIRIHDYTYNFILLISPKYKKAILKSDYFVK